MNEIIFENLEKLRRSNLEIIDETANYIKKIHTEWKNQIIIKQKNLISARKFLFDTDIFEEIDYRVYTDGICDDESLSMLCFKNENHLVIFKLWNSENTKENISIMINSIILKNIQRYVIQVSNIAMMCNDRRYVEHNHYSQDQVNNFFKKIISDDLRMWTNYKLICDYSIEVNKYVMLDKNLAVIGIKPTVIGGFTFFKFIY